MRLEPYNFVDDPYVVKNSKLGPICVKTLMKYLVCTAKVVERKLKALIPDKFGLVFDGWSMGGEHYNPIYFVSGDNNPQLARLLGTKFNGCDAHKLNLEDNDFIGKKPSLTRNTSIKLIEGPIGKMIEYLQEIPHLPASISMLGP